MITDGCNSEYRTIRLLIVISIEVIEFFPYSEHTFCNVHMVSGWLVPACRSRFRMFLCRDILSSLEEVIICRLLLVSGSLAGCLVGRCRRKSCLRLPCRLLMS